MNYQRQWDGTAWQQYSLRLAQTRHGGQNVQQVPDKVRGDCGIEFFVLDGCLYQCYAPEETFDTQKAASGMKDKARRDLKKLEKYKDTIKEILASLKARRWILLCPFLDDKDVVSYVREKGEELKALGLPFVADDFEALVQSQSDFESEIEILRKKSLGPPLKVPAPSDADVRIKLEGELGERLDAKLRRGFPDLPDGEREKRAQNFVRTLIIRDNTLDELKLNHPVLWEKSIRCLQAEEERLSALGNDGGHPSTQLRSSMERIETSLRQDLSDLSGATITSMSTGTVGDWLVRCPLDFPKGDE